MCVVLSTLRMSWHPHDRVSECTVIELPPFIRGVEEFTRTAARENVQLVLAVVSDTDACRRERSDVLIDSVGQTVVVHFVDLSASGGQRCLRSVYCSKKNGKLRVIFDARLANVVTRRHPLPLLILMTFLRSWAFSWRKGDGIDFRHFFYQLPLPEVWRDYFGCESRHTDQPQ